MAQRLKTILEPHNQPYWNKQVKPGHVYVYDFQCCNNNNSSSKIARDLLKNNVIPILLPDNRQLLRHHNNLHSSLNINPSAILPPLKLTIFTKIYNAK